jgi:hypothetical protein
MVDVGDETTYLGPESSYIMLWSKYVLSYHDIKHPIISVISCLTYHVWINQYHTIETIYHPIPLISNSIGCIPHHSLNFPGMGLSVVVGCIYFPTALMLLGLVGDAIPVVDMKCSNRRVVHVASSNYSP